MITIFEKKSEKMFLFDQIKGEFIIIIIFDCINDNSHVIKFALLISTFLDINLYFTT